MPGGVFKPKESVNVSPLADIFPPLSADDKQSLTESINVLGVKEPVKVWRGAVVDGKHRLAISKSLGRECPYERLSDKLTEQQVVMLMKGWNLARRHLTASQKAMASGRMAEFFKPSAAEREAAPLRKNDEKPAESSLAQICASEKGKATELAAKTFGVSTRSTEMAVAVLERGDGELIAAVDAGEVAVSDAAAIVKQPKKKQRKAVKAVREKKAKTLRHAINGQAGEQEEVLDSLKAEVPESLRDVFAQVKSWQATMREVSDCKRLIRLLADHPAGGRLDIQEAERMLDQTRSLLRFAMPYTECVKCRRKLDKKCPACRGTGWLHESGFKSCASDDDKKWLEKR